MTRVIVSRDKLVAVADAIRAKTETTKALTLDEMPQAIESIQGGGGGSGVDYVANALENKLTAYSSTEVSAVVSPVFYQQGNLTTVSLVNCKSLCASAFYECTALKTLDILGGGSIGSDCFRSCDSLETLVMRSGQSVTTMNAKFFPYYMGKGNITRNFTRAKWNTYGKAGHIESWSSLKTGIKGAITYFTGTVTDEDSKPVWLFGKYVAESTQLETLALVETEEEFNELEQFYIRYFADDGRYIYVPTSLIDTYKNATNWAPYGDKFKPLEGSVYE